MLRSRNKRIARERTDDPKNDATPAQRVDDTTLFRMMGVTPRVFPRKPN